MTKKISIRIILLLSGLVVFVLGNPYYRVFPTNWNQTFYVALAAFFLIAALVCRQNKSLARYWTAVYALFIASAALVSLKTGVIQLHQAAMPPMQNLALDKFSQFLLIVPVLIGLTLLAGDDLASIFIKKGKLKRGLTFGIVSFILFAIAAFVMQSGSVEFSLVMGNLHWLLLFIFSNSIMEELWFRAIFLRKFAALTGRMGAILITAVFFGASHINATYDFPGGGIVFGVVVFGLGFVGAYAMFRDDSLIGPVLFHAGYDLMIIVPVINSM